MFADHVPECIGSGRGEGELDVYPAAITELALNKLILGTRSSLTTAAES